MYICTVRSKQDQCPVSICVRHRRPVLRGSFPRSRDKRPIVSLRTLSTSPISRDLRGFEQIANEDEYEPWDRCVARGAEEYSNRFHNLICDNCNHHVARTLNIMGYDGHREWGMFTLWMYILVHGKSVGVRGFCFQYGPFVLICAGVLVWALVASI